jgi:hypothetical protein
VVIGSKTGDAQEKTNREIGFRKLVKRTQVKADDYPFLAVDDSDASNDIGRISSRRKR